MPPKDLQSLIAQLLRDRAFASLSGNLLSAWGPVSKRLLGPDFLPPRLVEENEGTISRVRYRTIAAADSTRYSPVQIVDGGEMFGSIRYRLADSDIGRQMVGPDYDGLVRWLNRNVPMQAAAAVIGFFDQGVIQALAERDELAVWDAIVFNKLVRRGDNGYFEYEDGPDLTNHRVAVGGDWSDPTYNPWPDIFGRGALLVGLGFDKGGVRIVSTDQGLTLLKNNPFTGRLAGKVALVTNGAGQVVTQNTGGVVTDEDLGGIFRANGLRAPVAYDTRISTRTGERRAYPEGHMTFIASTGRTEEVRYNTDNPADVSLLAVNDTLGFNGIGKANGETDPGRRSLVEAFIRDKDKRIEMKGWQTTGPIILEPTAIADLSGIE